MHRLPSVPQIVGPPTLPRELLAHACRHILQGRGKGDEGKRGQSSIAFGMTSRRLAPAARMVRGGRSGDNRGWTQTIALPTPPTPSVTCSRAPSTTARGHSRAATCRPASGNFRPPWKGCAGFVVTSPARMPTGQGQEARLAARAVTEVGPSRRRHVLARALREPRGLPPLRRARGGGRRGTRGRLRGRWLGAGAVLPPR